MVEIDPYLSIQSIVIDEENPKRMFVGLSHGGIPYSEAGTNGGLYLTEDEGKSWTKLYDGTVNLIRLDYNEPRYIYFGTKFGLMRMRDTLVTEVEDDSGNIPVNFSLSQNYPNPFSKGSGGNPTTTVKFQLPEQAVVKIALYDILGRKVKEIFNQSEEAGTYKLQLDGNGLGSGVYILQMNADGVSKNYIHRIKVNLIK